MKRVDIALNLYEINLLLESLDTMRQKLGNDVKSLNRLEEVLTEQKDYLEEDYTSEESREGRKEYESWLRSGK